MYQTIGSLKRLSQLMAGQAVSSVAITGGTINGVALGGTTPAAGAFTTIAASGQTTLSGVLQFGSTATAAVLSGAGNSTTAYSMGTTADKNLLGFYADSTATSGDTRLAYLKLFFSGVGVSGEALRAYGVVNNKTVATGGTVNGAHISLAATGASGKVSGAGNALRATLEIGASCDPGGTLAAIQADSFFDNAGTVPTNAAAIRVTNSGTKLWANFLNVPAPTSGGLVAAHGTDAMTHSIRIVDSAGTKYYLMATTDASNRTGGA